MKEFIINEETKGQRLDKYLIRLLPNAGSSFLYKMLRKKNITLNGKKAEGREMLKNGDKISIFFSDDTFDNFSKTAEGITYPTTSLDILYEDNNIILINKPAGMLSQKSDEGDNSLVEYLIGYLLKSEKISTESLRFFRPAVCNRLDRNTSGLIIGAVSLPGAQAMNLVIKNRSLDKYYECLVAGRLSGRKELKGYLIKDEASNKVTVLEKPAPNAQEIDTVYESLGCYGDISHLRIKLLTGRSHQIRAHLASIGHPVIGDPKYGASDINRYFKQRFGVKYQLLHSGKVTLPSQMTILPYLSGRTFSAPLPEIFTNVLTAYGWGE